MSNTKEITKVFEGLPQWAKGVLAVAGLGIVVYVGYKIYNKFGEEQSRDWKEKKDIDNELDSSVKSKPLSYPLSQYSTFANAIETAGFDVGTDENAIYSVFYKLKNDSDYLALQKAWGKPTRTVYDWGIGRQMTMPQYLRYEMSESEIKKINNILISKKIKYRV